MVKRVFKFVHLMGTVWLILCVGLILVAALREAGFRWWVIFSLSGHSAVMVFLLVSLYLFAVYRGTRPSQQIEVEHPLTSTAQYKVFYIATPFLGGLAGLAGLIGTTRTSQLPLGVALGTLAATFLVWVILDPAVGLLETLFPASRKHRQQRIARARALRREEQERRERLLADVLSREQEQRRQWQRILRPHAQTLAGLLVGEGADFTDAERTAADIGVIAWQTGGQGCMQQLRDMALEICRQRGEAARSVDYTSTWWDGIGTWRKTALPETIDL
jgi:hypothetical protein